jgi:hypothetical protein
LIFWISFSLTKKVTGKQSLYTLPSELMHAYVYVLITQYLLV